MAVEASCMNPLFCRDSMLPVESKGAARKCSYGGRNRPDHEEFQGDCCFETPPQAEQTLEVPTSLRGHWRNSIALEGSCMSSLFCQDSMLPVESKGAARKCSYGGRNRPDQEVFQGDCCFETPQAEQTLEPTWRGGGLQFQDELLRSSSRSMFESTSEILTAGDEDACQCSSANNDSKIDFMGHFVMPRVPHTASSGVSCLQQRRAESGASLRSCMAHDNHADYLSSGGESEDSLGALFLNVNSCGGGLGSSTMGLKRRFDDADEEPSWMDLREHKSPKLNLLQEEKALIFQNRCAADGTTTLSLRASYLQNPPGHNAAIGTTNSGSASQSASVFATAAPVPSHELQQDENDILQNKMANMRAILFRGSLLPVPTAAEIESSRPKRRNVRISKDPQSVAARHRRERISDRIRVLQRLVPGGTKMDTASMLDEAIQYVKFLKLQLQTLEQLGKGLSCDPRYSHGSALGTQGGQSSSVTVPPLAEQPFDLNSCFTSSTVYNQSSSSREAPGPCGAAPLVTTVSLQESTDSPTASGSHISSPGVVWPNLLTASSALMASRPFGSPGPQIPDPLPEQFCH